MKKITNESVDALLSNKNFKKSNTEVKVLKYGTFLYLWKNAIAFTKSEDMLYIDLCKYNTLTTRERLNGLPGVNIKFAKGVLTLNGNEWDGKLTRIK
jgi:hypothetical protein